MAPAYDASLFATMGKMWADGAVLYRDMIDIKKGGRSSSCWMRLVMPSAVFGIWLLETVLLIWGLNALYRTLALWGIAPLSRLAGMLAWLFLYAYRYYYGNMTKLHFLSGINRTVSFCADVAGRTFPLAGCSHSGGDIRADCHVAHE